MRSFPLLVPAVALLGPLVFGQPAAGLLQKLERTVTYGDINISPDGKRLAWVQGTAGGARANAWWMVIGEGAASPVTLATAPPHREANPAWSHDSQSLAFFSNLGGKGAMQLWIAAGKRLPSRITQVKGHVERAKWSPDDKQIAFLYVEGASGGGPLTGAQAQTGVIDTAIHNQRIAVVDVATGKPRQVSPAGLHVYDFDWSPDGRRFVVTAAPGPGDNNWWIARIYMIDIATGEAKSIHKPALQVGLPRWSPDGKQIAFIEGLMSDEGFHGGDLFTMPADGGAPVIRTPGRATSPSSIHWITPDRLEFTEWVDGGSAISMLDLKTGVIETLWRGAENAHSNGYGHNFALSADGRMSAIVRESFTAPPEVWAGPVGDWKQLTRNNAAPPQFCGKPESLEWTTDGMRVQGWLLPPKDAGEGKHPMIVVIHGGPSNLSYPKWPSDYSLPALFAARGYYVLLPNPRGSYGKGETFTRANVKDFGGGDLRDILGGVDHALAHYPIDPERLGITGWSYGGYMTMWSVTQTNRFRAAVAGAGIANWQSYYGENSIDQWMIPFFGASVYDDPAVYAQSSPIQFIKNVKTPTLVVVGEWDMECPAPQSFEFWHALKTFGVPTQLVVYPGEGHWFTKAKHRFEMQERTVDWFDQYLKK